MEQKYSDRIDQISHELDMLDARIEEEQYTVSASSYNRDDKNNALNQEVAERRKQMKLLNKEAKRLQEELDAAVKAGAIKEGTEEWYAMKAAIGDVEKEAKDTAKEIRETYDKMFDAIAAKYEATLAEIENRSARISKDMELAYYTGAIKEYGALVEQYAQDYAYHTAKARDMQAELDRRMASTNPEEHIEYGSQAWLEKQQEIWQESEAAADAQLNMHQTYVDEFEDIQQRYDTALSAIDNANNLLQGGLDELEARGYLGGASLYQGMIDNETKRLETLGEERARLESALAKAVAEGAIAEGSEAWYAARAQIDAVTQSIQEATNKTLEYANAIRQIDWDKFDYARDRVADIVDETEFLTKLLGYSDLVDEKGKFTSEGEATMGMYALNYNVYSEQARAYAEEIQRLNADIAKDPNNEKLLARRRDLLDAQREAILAAQEEKKAVHDLVEDSIEAQIDAMKELIDKYEEQLDAEHDLYSYQKNIAKQTKEIASLQKQLSAYSGDTSEENRARLQKLQVSLEEANEQLAETQYEQYISDQKKILDSLLEEYEDTLNKRLDNIDALMNQAIGIANTTASSIMTTIMTATSDVGASISTTMSGIWGETGAATSALSTYSQGVADNFSATNDAIDGVETAVENLYAGGDTFADTKLSDIKSATEAGFTNISALLTGVQGAIDKIIEKIQIPTVGGETPSSSAGSTASSGAGSGTGSSGAGSGTGRKDPRPEAVPRKYVTVNHDTKLYNYSKSGGFKEGKTIIPSGKKFECFGTIKADDGTIYTIIDYNGKERYLRYAHAYSITSASGFSKGGYIAEAQKIAYRNGDDIVTMNTLKRGEAVLTPEQAAMFKRLTGSLPDLVGAVDIAKNLRTLSTVPNSARGDVNVGGITVTIPIEHIDDYNDFVRQLRDDKNFERMVQTITLNPLIGKSTITKKRLYN